MKLTLLIVFIFAVLVINSFLVKVQTLHYVAPIAVATTTPKSVKLSPNLPVVQRKDPTPSQAQIILQKSAYYGVDPVVLIDVIRCESEFNETVQSHIIQKDGTREESYGIAQWHLPSGNTKQDGSVITLEDALNPEVAIDLMAWYFSEGKERKWSCYNKIYAKA